jgi:D-beta-D-heptose 7-phosphate kinase/D-beta-D-heptose 1-phosphate adenosyltransferase
MRDLFTALTTLQRPRILVVGDLILDRYTWGDVDRVSPEAPVLVLRADRAETRPGGAASVAALLRALEGDVSLVGITGDDASGQALRTLLSESGITQDGVLADVGRVTTTKERFMGRAAHRHAQQILRVDHEETHPVAAVLESRLIDAIRSQIAGHALVVVSDYGKGVCTPAVLRAVITDASARGVPVFIDPARKADYGIYRGASALIPNRVEAGLASGQNIVSPDDALAAARDLRDRFGVAAVLVKLDRDGVVLVEQGDAGRVFSTQAREVYDVTGAGDMMLAMLAVGRGSGLHWDEAVALANVAAGLEVERLGVAPITRTELWAECSAAGLHKHVTLEQMALLADAYRRQGKKVVFTNGCFDLLHVGHANYLREAARLGDVLIVGVNSDAGVRRLKGPERPVINQTDRAAMLAALAWVDHVLIFDEDTPLEVVRRLRPDVLVKGGTYAVEDIVGRDVVESYGGKVCVTGKTEGVSTTDILAAVRRK